MRGLIGVILDDAVIDGLVSNLVVNGVEVSGYVEAELDRRHPVRVLIRSDDPAELREAWGTLTPTWAATYARLEAAPAGTEHQRVERRVVGRARPCDTWSSSTTRGSAAAVSVSPTSSRPWGWRSTPFPTRRSRVWTAPLHPRWPRSGRCARRQAAELGAWLADGHLRALQARRRCPTARAGRRTPAAGRCPVPARGPQRGVRAPRLLRARPRPPGARGRWLGSAA